MLEVISSFKGLSVRSQLFALLILIRCVIVQTMWSGKSLQLLCILALWYVVLVCLQYDVCKNYVGSVYVCGFGGLSVNCVQSAFL